MVCRRYQAYDFDQVREWGRHYGAEYEEDRFPEVGFIVEGVCAYFLYETNSSICFMENLVANKYAERADRGRAIDLVTEAVVSEARRLGYKTAYATTDLPGVVFRALSMGASSKPKQTLLTKTLTNGPSDDGQKE